MKLDLSKGLSEELLARIRKDTKMETARELTVAMPPGAGPLYIIETEGFVPELMAVSYRRAKHFNTRDRKIIKCPYCGEIFITVDKSAKLKLLRHSGKAAINLDYSKQCGACYKTIGIIYATA